MLSLFFQQVAVVIVVLAIANGDFYLRNPITSPVFEEIHILTSFSQESQRWEPSPILHKVGVFNHSINVYPAWESHHPPENYFKLSKQIFFILPE